jgi:hypothetical protein
MQTFLDRPREKPASVSIERIGGPLRPVPLTAERLERNLAATSAFVHGTARTFADWTQMFRAKPNTLETLDQSLFYKTGGDPRIFYLHGYWALALEEALVIDTPVPECEIWNIQLNNYWMESLDYRYMTGVWEISSARRATRRARCCCAGRVRRRTRYRSAAL